MTSSDSTRQYINVAAMFDGVKPEFKKLLLSHKHELQLVLEQLDPNDVSPRSENIMNFARFADLAEIRVCIIGQDPYPDINHAHGLAFSTLSDKLPLSLKNIYSCLSHHGYISRNAPIPKGNLTSWAQSGVLLLNTALTTAPGIADAHKNIWSEYMRKVIASIGKLDQPIVYFLWGGHAQKYAPVLNNCGKALVLKEPHPSPICQGRLSPDKKFMHCNHFTKANEFLAARGLGMINWNPAGIQLEVKSDTSESTSAAPGPIPAASGPMPAASGPMPAAPGSTLPGEHVAYTDGSSSDNGNPLARAGYGAYFTSGSLTGLKLSGRIGPVQIPGEEEFIFPSNIRGEGFAIIRALEHVLALPGIPMIEIVTDSEFWINMVKTFMPRWVRDGIPWSAKKNPDMTRLLWTLACDFDARGGSLKMRHIYSHGKDKNISPIDRRWNDVVDRIAGEARNAPEFFESAVTMPI